MGDLFCERYYEDMNNNRNIPVFVYGSLKQGFGNNLLLSDAEYVGEYCTSDEDYAMISLGAFPAVIPNGMGSIVGEVYNINILEMARLDRLEGNGHFYTRRMVEVISPYDEEEKLSAWMYVLEHVDFLRMDPAVISQVCEIPAYFEWKSDQVVEAFNPDTDQVYIIQ